MLLILISNLINNIYIINCLNSSNCTKSFRRWKRLLNPKVDPKIIWENMEILKVKTNPLSFHIRWLNPLRPYQFILLLIHSLPTLKFFPKLPGWFIKGLERHTFSLQSFVLVPGILSHCDNQEVQWRNSLTVPPSVPTWPSSPVRTCWVPSTIRTYISQCMHWKCEPCWASQRFKTTGNNNVSRNQALKVWAL